MLDLGRTSETDFTERDAIVAENFAAQLGLYLYLDNQLENRLRLQSTLREQQEAQLRTFENLRHQIYGPVGTVAMALERLLARPGLTDSMRTELTLARGDALRASVMVRSLDLFAALASGRRPRVQPQRLSESWLRPRLEELAAHQRTLAGEERRLTFVVSNSGWEDLRSSLVYCDLNLLEHAASNLLENARKYSGRGTMVLVVCGVMNRGREFFMAVQNEGLRIQTGDVSRMTERGWRSDEAWKVAGDSTGIGLHVVDAIMAAHKGRLQITPTNSTNVNDVRLVFPVGRPPVGEL